MITKFLFEPKTTEVTAIRSKTEINPAFESGKNYQTKNTREIDSQETVRIIDVPPRSARISVRFSYTT